jgi:hypothetical protein
MSDRNDTRQLLSEVNDPMSGSAAIAGTWGDPSAPSDDDPAHLLRFPGGFDYSGGMFAELADAGAPQAHPGILPLRTDLDIHSYETVHEATHRRYEPPQVVPVNQAAAGFTLIAPPTGGLHYIKVLGVYLTLDAAGTLRFVQGDSFGNNNAPMTGNMNLGGAAVPPLALPMAEIPNPWFFTSPDQALGIFTAVGKAQGWVVICNSPYDA